MGGPARGDDAIYRVRGYWYRRATAYPAYGDGGGEITVRIEVLGTLQVHGGDGRAVKVGGHRVRALLILLALDAGHVVPSHALIERLWPDERPVDAANALQSLVSRLRAALRQAGIAGGAVESSPVGYRLAVPPDAVDAVAFEAAARAGGRALAAGDVAAAARLLREALTAWRGPALADVAGEEFAIAPAARLEELRSTAVLDRIEADLALGAGSGLIGELRELTTADPLAERPRALLMHALAAAGRQAEALAVYADARQLLADRLGVDPSPRLEQAYLAILRREVPAQQVAADLPLAGAAPPDYPERTPDPPATAPARQPAALRPPTSFIGRDDDVSGVLKKLAEERLVTLAGPGGVGKTRLAAEAAARLSVPVWFAELAPVSEPSEVAHAVLDALGLREPTIARHSAEAGALDPADRLCGVLAGRDAVLILDNCEHVIEAAARLSGRLLADCPRVRILATSREPLRISGETLWPVAPLPVPSPPVEPDIANIAASPAVRLFRDRAAAVLPGFTVDERNAAAVARVCRALDGMPLAIELAAVWSRTLPPAQLAERLDDRFALLTSGSRTALPRHQTLRAVVDWSWNLLSEPERTLARRLAVFPAGATLEAAEQVCADTVPSGAGPAGAGPSGGVPASSGLARAAVLPALSGLVGKSILAATDDPGDCGPRYRMLETVRAYALERLAEAGEETPVKDAFAAYYLGLAETADPLLRTAGQARWFRELAAEQDNVHAALRWAIGRGDAACALRFVRALGYYWTQRGRGEGEKLAREVLAFEPPGDCLLIAEARVVCALMAAGHSWDLETIRGPLTDALASLARWTAGGAAIHPVAAMAEPMLAQVSSDPERALAAIEGYTTVDDPWLRAAGWLYRSTQCLTLGRMADTEADCRKALAQFRTLGDAWGTAVSLMQLAELAQLRGDYATAVAALKEATEIGRDLQAWGDMGYMIGMLAVARARAGDADSAVVDLRRAERAVADLGPAGADEWLLFSAAEIAWRAGDLAEAERCCVASLNALEAKRTVWYQGMSAQAEARLAMIALAGGDADRCRERLAAALAAGRDWMELPPLAAAIDGCAAFALRAGGDAEAGATLLGAAHSIRGAFDESSLAAPDTRAAARRALGAAGFDAAYRRGRELGQEAAVTLALAQVRRR
jgi:predicted ATPase/DNA-binding SARP family transcriptional activator